MTILRYSGRGNGVDGRTQRTGFINPHSNTYRRHKNSTSFSTNNSGNLKWQQPKQAAEQLQTDVPMFANGDSEGGNESEPLRIEKSTSSCDELEECNKQKTIRQASFEKRSSQKASENKFTNASNKKERPVLKGPSLRQVGGHVWKRSKTSDTQDRKHIVTGDISISHYAPRKVNIIEQRSQLERLGNLKYLSNKTEPSGVSKLQKMSRIGQNKLVLKTQQEALITSPNSSASIIRQARHNNLAVQQRNTDFLTTSNGTESLDQRRKRPLPSGFKKDSVWGKKPLPKRIQLSVKNSEEDGQIHNESDIIQDNHENPLFSSLETGESDAFIGADQGKCGKTIAGDESVRLTDHAYLETSRQTCVFTNNRKWERGVQASESGAKSMGLVRVQTEESKMPLCPVFLRGMSCIDETCRKRHDVPKEFALPVCSFFQRQGMCWKQDVGTCPFRHIKINPRATECPSFRLLGYCEDKQCLMMHSNRRPKNPL